MHGTEDERTELKHSETLYSEARSSKKDIKRYNGAKHQLLQDTPEITAAVISDIINWFNEQVAT
jgi:alpha-beta hydrolase superfamily lysophospholipase